MNTGWQIRRSIVAVAQNNNTIKVDRNGLPCIFFNAQGVPVSVAGNRQAARVWTGVGQALELVPGSTFTYSQLFDILGTYSVNTTSQPTNTPIVDSISGVMIAEYQGGALQLCPIPANFQTDIRFTIGIDNNAVNQSVEVFYYNDSNVGSSAITQVDWGDGSIGTITYPGNIAQQAMVHTYTQVGNYEVKITEMTERIGGVLIGSKLTQSGHGWAPYSTLVSLNKCKRVTWNQTPINFQFQYMGTSGGVTTPVTFASGFQFETPAAVNLDGMFFRCRLGNLPANLFALCSSVKTAIGTFQLSVISATAIPAALFDGCPLLNNVISIFDSSNISTAQMSGAGLLFSKNPAITTFETAFSGCSNLGTLPSGFLASNVNVLSYKGIFKTCTSLSVLNNFQFASPVATDFSEVFYNCIAADFGSNLANSQVFQKCTAAQDFSYALASTGSFSGYLRNLFTNCPNATSFRFCFYNTNIYNMIDVFVNNTKIQDLSYCFASCLNLQNIQSLGNNQCFATLTNLSNMFSNCINIAGYVDALFYANTPQTGVTDQWINVKLPNVTDVSSMYLACLKMSATVPSSTGVARFPSGWSFVNRFPNASLNKTAALRNIANTLPDFTDWQ